MWELILATNFGSPLQMVTKVGSQILATKFGFVPDCLLSTKVRLILEVLGYIIERYFFF